MHLATLYGAQKVKSMYLDDDNAIMAANQSWLGQELNLVAMVHKVVGRGDVKPCRWVAIGVDDFAHAIRGELKH